MVVATRIVRCALFAAVLAVAPAMAGASEPSPWSERHGSYVLPAQDSAPLGLVALENRATHRVVYGFRDLPQRMRCAPASVGHGQVFDVEGQRIAFSKECIGGIFTYLPRNLPARNAFEQKLASTQILHVLTQSFFPLSFDLSGLPVVRQTLDLAVARRRQDR